MEIRKPLKQYRKKLFKKPTKAEQEFRNLLRKHGIKFIFQKQYDTPKYKCIVDFLITGKNIVIELDGKYHRGREQVNKDKYRDYWLRKNKGIKVVRIENEDIYKFDFNKLK